MSKFLEQLDSILNKLDSLESDEVKSAFSLIRRRRAEIKNNGLKSFGLCLYCRQVEITYDPCQPHRRRGDSWLEKLFKEWGNGDLYISVDIDQWGRIKKEQVNGYALSTTLAYSCKSCQEIINNAVIEETEKAREELKTVKTKETENEWEVVQGNVRASITKRFRLLHKFINEDTLYQLKVMPYKEFLQSLYWDIVRKYKLYKDGFRCKLCNKGGYLQVHHRTYEHHGYEHLYLDDLIVLCGDCHAKFHNKLPVAPES